MGLVWLRKQNGPLYFVPIDLHLTVTATHVAFFPLSVWNPTGASHGYGGLKRPQAEDNDFSQTLDPSS